MNIDDYVLTNRKVLKLVGLYPANMVRYFMCTICMLLIVIPQTVQIFENWRDLTVVLETSSVLLTIILAILKSLVWIWNREDVESFINFMLTDYWSLATKINTSMYLDIYATYAKKISKGYLFLICNALLFFFSLPLIEIFISVIEEANVNSTKHFPFVALYPNIYYKSPLYEIVYISQMAATIICGLIILATDTFIATALFHTCGHFKILQENLANLDMHISYIHRIYKEQRHSSELLKKAKYEMRDIIKHHHVALWFCGNMEKNFNPILLLQVLASSLIICLVGLQVTTTLENQSKLIQYFSYLLMALFQLLLFCFPGDLLIQQSSNVSNAAYSIQWYKLPNPMRQDVQLLIMRSQKPSCITAGKFYTMHLENFSSVLSTALSYFTMLRSIN